MTHQCSCGREYRTWIAAQYCWLRDHDFPTGAMDDRGQIA